MLTSVGGPTVQERSQSAEPDGQFRAPGILQYGTVINDIDVPFNGLELYQITYRKDSGRSLVQFSDMFS